MIKKLLMLLIIIAFVSCKKEPQEFKEERFLFGTYIQITVFDDSSSHAKKAIQTAFDEIQRIDNKFNSHKEGSEIDKLNKMPEKGIDLDAEGNMLFDKINDIYNLSNGRFDITVEPLLDLWGFGKENPTIPSKERLKAALKEVDYRLVIREGNHISLKKPLKQLNTGSFLKGYATARAKAILKKEGIKNAFVTTISSIETLGGKAIGPWRIGIQNPSEPSKILNIVNLDGQAMGISGDYQTYVEINGKRYHHILDPETGYPAKGKKLVAVICKDALMGDLYSTAFFLMDTNKVIDYVETIDGLEVYIVDSNMNIIKSSGFDKFISKK